MASLESLQSMRNQYFQQRRGDANQNAFRTQQEGEDALNRRFASLGAQGTGASIAALQKNRDMAAEGRNKAIADIQGQELQAGEGDIARQAAADENRAARGFQGTEAEKQRQFQGGLAGQDLAFKQSSFNTEQSNKLKELELAQQQFNLDKETTEFNKNLAAAEAGGSSNESGLGGVAKSVQSGIASIAPDFGQISGSTNPMGAVGGVVGRAVGVDVSKALGGGGK